MADATDSRRARLTRRWPTRSIFLIGLALAGMAPPVAAQEVGQNSPSSELREAVMTAMEADDGFNDRYAAEVWLADKSNRLAAFIDDPVERLELLRAIYREAHKADLQPELVLAVIEVESAFERFAISVVGARGLMQVMPFWLDEIGRPDDNLFHINTNLRMGCAILRHYLDKENGDLIRALARYNGSLGRHDYPLKVLRALNGRWAPN